MINKQSIARDIVKFVTSAATSAVVTNAIRSTSPINMNFGTKVLVVLGEIAISGLVSDLTGERAAKKFDEMIGRFHPKQS